MFFLVIAILALLASTQLRSRKYVSLAFLVAALFYGALIAWILLEGGLRVFGGGEAGLLGWFVAGLALSLLGFFFKNRFLPLRGGRRPTWQSPTLSAAAVPLAAVCYALGFDVLRPDAYSYVPAAILGALVLIVAFQAFLRLAPTRKRTKLTRFRDPKSKIRNQQSKILLNSRTFQLALYILTIAVLVYSATFKVIDRGWLLPWSYMAAAGGILFALAQLWSALGLGSRSSRKGSAPTFIPHPSSFIPAVMRLGELLMVVSAFFVYREFL